MTITPSGSGTRSPDRGALPAAGHTSTDPATELTVLDPDHRVYQQASARGPALVVLGVAVLIVALGVLGSVLFSSSGKTSSTPSSISLPGGSVVRLTPATTALKSIVSVGQPPADIVHALAVPADSPVTRTVDADQGVSQFDRTVHFTSGMTAGQLIDLYRTLLPRLGWRVIFHGTGASIQSADTEVLAKKASSDTYYWEVGVVVSPTTSAGTTSFSLEVLEVPDDNT